MSPPRENVLLVPHRSVLLASSGWEGARTRSSNHDPAGQRPPGSAQESAQEADYAKAGSRGVRPDRSPGSEASGADERSGRPRRDSRAARPRIQSQAERGYSVQSDRRAQSGSLSRLRSDAGQRVSGEETQAHHRPGSVAAAHDRSRIMAQSAAESRDHSRMAAAEKLAWRDGAVG